MIMGNAVLTMDGNFTNFAELKAGMLVMGPDSIPRTIVSLSSKQSNAYTILPKYGEPFVVNDDTVLILKSVNEGKSKWRLGAGVLTGTEIVKVTVKEYLTWSHDKKRLHKLFKAGCLNFPEQPYIIDPYMLGVLLGDGGLSQRTVNVTTMDRETVDSIYAFANHMNVDVRIEVLPNNKSDMYFFTKRPNTGVFNPVSTELRKLELMGHTSHTKFIPAQYKIASKEQRLQILAGLVDTDGCIEKATSCFSICTASQALSNDITFIARSLGLRATIHVYNRNTGTYYNVAISNTDLNIPTRLPRKLITHRIQKKDPLKFGFTVEPYNGITASIVVDGDGLFIIDGFTIMGSICD